jgi:hypothetical protein
MVSSGPAPLSLGLEINHMWFRLSAASLQHLQAMAANLDWRFANNEFGGILFFLYCFFLA